MTSPPRVPRRSGHTGAQWYLGTLLTAAVLLEALAFLTAVRGTPLTPVATVLVVVAGPGVAVVLWWRDDDPKPRTAQVAIVLAGMGALWGMAAVSAVGSGDSLSLSALLLPVLLLLVWGKPASAGAARKAAMAFACALAAVSAVSLVMEAAGALPSWYVMAGVDRLGWIEADRAAYWLPLADLMGLDGRWAGPFNHPNIAGMVGAFLVVFGAQVRGLSRVALCLVGAVVLLSTSSRTSMAAALGGLCVLLGAWWLARPSRLSRTLRAMLAGLPVLLMLLLWVTANPGLTGRTSIWPVYASLWQQAPLLGLGQTGIDAAVQDGRLPDWAHHGHSLVLDTAARHGLLGLAVLGLVLVTALVGAAAAARRGQALGLALLVTVLVAGLTETTLRWLYLTVPVAMVLLAVLLSGGTASAVPPGRPPAPVRGSDPDPDRERSAEGG